MKKYRVQYEVFVRVTAKDAASALDKVQRRIDNGELPDPPAVKELGDWTVAFEPIAIEEK